MGGRKRQSRVCFRRLSVSPKQPQTAHDDAAHTGASALDLGVISNQTPLLNNRSYCCRIARKALDETRNGATLLARLWLFSIGTRPTQSGAGRRRRLSSFGRTGLGCSHSFLALWPEVLTQVNDGAAILVDAAHLEGCPDMAVAL